MTTIIVGSLLLAVSCTSSDAGSSPASPETTGSEPTSVAEGNSGDYDGLDDQWREVWTIAGLPKTERAEQIESIEPYLSDEAYELVDGFFTVGVDSKRLPLMYPKFDEGDGVVTISDCVVWDLPDEVGVSKWMEATAERDGENGEWTFTEITKKADDCVPEEVGEKVIADYEASIEAQKQYWNPADPNHPGIEATVGEPWKETLIERLTEVESKGWYLVTEPEIHPEIFEMLSPELIKVLDCQTEDSAGLFDAEGERQEGVAERRPGQRSAVETLMELNGDTWKVIDIQAQRDWDCEFAPTDEGFPWV